MVKFEPDSHINYALDIKPKDYVDQGTDEDTGHGRKFFDGQSLHGDTVSLRPAS